MKFGPPMIILRTVICANLYYALNPCIKVIHQSYFVICEFMKTLSFTNFMMDSPFPYPTL